MNAERQGQQTQPVVLNIQDSQAEQSGGLGNSALRSALCVLGSSESGQALVLAAVSLMGIVLVAFLVFNIAHLAVSIQAITEGLWLAAESGSRLLDEAARGHTLADPADVEAVVAQVAAANLARHEVLFDGLSAREVVQFHLELAISPADGPATDPFSGHEYVGPFVVISTTIPLKVLWGAVVLDRRFHVVAANGQTPSGTPTPGTPDGRPIAPTREVVIPTPTPGPPGG